jgi:hypothetical protein
MTRQRVIAYEAGIRANNASVKVQRAIAQRRERHGFKRHVVCIGVGVELMTMFLNSCLKTVRNERLDASTRR